jgi:hypothetical protein
MSPENLVQFIAEEAAARGEVLSPIRVVKFLYLADVYHARYQGGQTLTGWPWRFVHYGPYCREALAAIDQVRSRGLVTTISFQSKYDGEEHVLYKGIGGDLSTLRNALPLSMVGPLAAAIARWASDTQGLLDHVYFDTEPMKYSRRGDLLDFSRCVPPERPAEVTMKKLTRDQIAKAREALSRLREKFAAGLAEQETRWRGEVLDESYAQLLRALRDPELETGLEGKAELGELT